MRGEALLTIVAFAGLLAACQPCGLLSSCPALSDASQRVEGLPKSEREAVVATLSVEQRLDIYHDTYIRSGHPRRMLMDMFEGAADPAFDAIMGRMVSASSFDEYFWIIHHLSLAGELDVCAPERFGRLEDKVRRFNRVDPKHPVPIEFNGCVVTL